MCEESTKVMGGSITMSMIRPTRACRGSLTINTFIEALIEEF